MTTESRSVAASNRPKIAVFSTGGTIASMRQDGGAAAPSLTAEELVKALPQLSDVAEVRTFRFRQLPSSDLTISDMIALAQEIRRAIDDGVRGAIVTQGTDTLEETSFVLDLLWEREEPVVLTGAMRNPALPGADGPANLLAAALVAVCPTAHGLGSLVVFNDEVHLPLFVRKVHTSNPGAFHSPLTGPIGWIVENRARIALRPVVRHHIGISSVPPVIPPVALATVSLGDDGRLLGPVGSLGYEGLVVEATGGGHVPGVMVEPLAALARTMPVVLTSRAGSGELLRNTYGFPGAETDLLKRGLIHAGLLDGAKSRVLLTLLLLVGAGREIIVEAFDAIGNPGSRPAFRLTR
jgi:L-asparaginase